MAGRPSVDCASGDRHNGAQKDLRPTMQTQGRASGLKRILEIGIQQRELPRSPPSPLPVLPFLAAGARALPTPAQDPRPALEQRVPTNGYIFEADELRPVLRPAHTTLSILAKFVDNQFCADGLEDSMELEHRLVPRSSQPRVCVQPALPVLHVSLSTLQSFQLPCL